MRPVSVIWLPSGGATVATGLNYRTSIASAQSLDIGESFAIDGTLAVPGTNAGPLVTTSTFGGGNAIISTNKNYASLLPLRQARTISIRSGAAGNVGTNYVVTGTYLGLPVSATIAGAAVNTAVESTQFFDTVTSITVTTLDMAGAATVGLGTAGQFQWILYNNHAEFPSLSVEVYVSGSAGTVTYEFVSTLDEITASPSVVSETIGIVVPDGSGAASYKTIMDGTAPTTPPSTVMGTTNNTYRYYTVRITGQSVATWNGALQATFIQAGII